MFDDACRQAIVARLHRLSPNTRRRWGRMTAPQMIAHLSDQMRHTLGDESVAARQGAVRWPPIRFAAIYLIPWPKGRIKGPPEAFVTKPTDWEKDMAGLEALICRFAECSTQERWPDHALFGHMTRRRWGVFVHKHFDHHLRQFGV
jgi:hypothetical protein